MILRHAMSLGLALIATATAGTLVVHLDSGPATAGAIPSMETVPVELVLLVDTSGSVDSTEYALQRDGYITAFRDARLGELVEAIGGVAVIYIEWSDTTHQSIRVPWTRLDTVADCQSFANQIAMVTRSASGETMIAPALEYAMARIDSNAYSSLKRVIDVSGDGRGENWEFFELGELTAGHTDPAFYGTPWNDVTAAVAAQGTQVNGICIGTEQELIDFYTDVLPQGDSAFMMQVDGFAQFAEGILEKLLREITTVPPQFD